MRFYWPIAKVDAEQRMVWGYASTEAEDDQGETITREALAAALDDYMRFANIREMHQPSAVGVATEAAIDDKGLYLGARIVDADAWQKVVAGVYKGFSIGGRVTARDPNNRRLITSLHLTEISVVDRPANPEAVFDCWKRSTDGQAPPHALRQVWDCGVAGHRHRAKAEAVRCLEEMEPSVATLPDDGGQVADTVGADEPGDTIDYADPGYRPDGRKRYPIDTEQHIRTAWAFIHQADHAGRYSAAQVAQIKARVIDAWRARIDPKGPPAIAADGHPAADAAQKAIAELANFLDRLGGEPPGAMAAMTVADTLHKAQRAELGLVADGLAKLVGEIVPRLDALQKRVEDIARTPLPPQTAGRGFAAIAKSEDAGGALVAGDDIVAALARMTEEERTLTLIKAAHASPIAPFGRPARFASR